MSAKYGTIVASADLLTTELNTLANNTLCSIGSAVDPSGSLEANIKLILGTQTARSAGAVVYLWLVPEEATVYSDATEACLGIPDVIFPLDAATTARTIVVPNVKLPNANFKAIVKNATGQAFAASGNTVTYERYAIDNV